ncbi:hypothetical protein PAGU2638_09960 [Lysobacter sp. PAGU 2638]
MGIERGSESFRHHVHRAIGHLECMETHACLAGDACRRSLAASGDRRVHGPPTRSPRPTTPGTHASQEAGFRALYRGIATESRRTVTLRRHPLAVRDGNAHKKPRARRHGVERK